MPYTRHLVVPDTQVKEGVPLEHLAALGKYIIKEKPPVIVMLGDFTDMESLSSYDYGKKEMEGRRYKKDIKVAHEAMDLLLKPMREYNAQQRKSAHAQYKPKMIMLLGNHENRINRAISDDAKLDGTISTDDLGYTEAGWEVIPFLHVIEIDGIAYSHFFPKAASGAVTQTKNGAPNARAQAIRQHMSCTSGHKQGIDFDMSQETADGRRIYSIIAGSFYMHDESYLGPQGNNPWKGVVMCNRVHEGQYDPCFVSLEYLLEKFND